MSGPRALVACCPDWPVTVAGYLPSDAVGVVHANRVVATSPAARAQGARPGMRRREVQATCPSLAVVQRDTAREVRYWDQVVAAVESFAPGVEVLYPGALALGSRGPSRYFGGDLPLGKKVVASVGTAIVAMGWAPWEGCCQVGVADGLFAAALAARSAPPGSPLVVPRGGTARFLAPQPLKVLTAPGLGAMAGGGAGGPAPAALVDLLGRLGLKTLGDFAALPAGAVLDRFGPAGLAAHRLARGLGERPVKGRALPPDWAVVAELDPPADQLQAAVFVGRALAEELHARMTSSGMVCTRLAVEAETEHGVTLRRSWRHDGALSATAIGERVRWQLEGWAQDAPTGPAQAGRITRLVLVPEEMRPDHGRQLGFWGGDAGAGERAARAMARVQSLLGPGAVVTAVLQGGRDYQEQVRLVPWGEPRSPLRPGSMDGLPPWPGRLPGVAPAVVHRSPVPALVADAAGDQVTVGSRGTLSAPPASVAIGGDKPQAVEVWAGPWPLEERWWEGGGRRRARLQVGTAQGCCYLLAREHKRWWVEASYD